MGIDYDGRRFRPAGEADAAACVAVYRQDGGTLWGEFSGGSVRRGALAGTCAPDGTLQFAYCMVRTDDEVVAGRCVSAPEALDDGRIRLRETWERYGAHASSGESWLEEIRS